MIVPAPPLESMPPPKLGRLNARQSADLRRSGLRDETIRAAGFRHIKGEAVRGVLGWSPKSGIWGDCLYIPYRDANGNETGFGRVKPDFPRIDDKGRKVKYETARQAGNKAYFPPGFAAAFKTAKTVVVSEGEKKCLSATQAGFCCVGLAGVWCFQPKRLRNEAGKPYGERRLLPELAALNWKGKTVVIAFDSDATEKDAVRLAEFRLAELLGELGADIRVARIPAVVAGGKTGVDDFLVHHGDDGPARLREVLDAAHKPKMPKMGPMDLARLLIVQRFTCKGGMTLRRWQAQFWRYDGRRYVVVSEEAMTNAVLRWLDQHGFTAEPIMATKVVKALGALCEIPESRPAPCWLDGEDHGDGWVSFANGLYRIGDPANVLTQPHSPKWFTPWSLDYDFDAAAGSPSWLAFLNEVFDGDAERIDLLQRWFGYLLASDTSFQKILFLVGPPRAGKGTITRTLIAMLGRENAATPTLTAIASRFGLANLIGSTAAIICDAHLGRHTDGAIAAERLKSISGEDPQDVDRKHLPELKGVRLPTRFVLACNEIAGFVDPSGALADRLCVLPFFNCYLGREDLTLESRLMRELPGIVNWALVGLARLRAAGRFNKPEKGEEIASGFRRLASPVHAFMEDCVERHSEFSESCVDVFTAWAGWCAANGHKAGSDARFGERLRSVDPAIRRARPKVEGVRTYVYEGLKLSPEGWENYTEEMKRRTRTALGPDADRTRTGGEIEGGNGQ